MTGSESAPKPAGNSVFQHNQFEAAVAKVHINADWPLHPRLISADG
jgi:hypothetical protein